MEQAQSAGGPAAARRQCEQAVAQLCARHDWHLLDPREFANRSLEHILAGTASTPHRAAVHTYSLALYQSCSGQEGLDRQERGYRELFRYLYDSAYHRFPDVAEDATQHAIEHIFRNFERCRDPGAFLAFAFQALRDAARSIRRQFQPIQSLDEPAGRDLEPLGAMVVDPGQVDPIEQVVADERQVHLRRFADEFLRKHPRAKDQLAALWLKYVSGLDDQAVGQRLGKPVRSIYVLRSRAVRKLRADPSWRALALEWGVLSDDG